MIQFGNGLKRGTVGGFGSTKFVEPIPNNADSISVGLNEKLSGGIYPCLYNSG